jgi:hypothetical protein
VTDVETSDDGISFKVDRVGVPILVRTSYFPSWKVEGAEGPYRSAPNFMVVVPTSNEVKLTYGYTGIELGSYALTAVGLAGLVYLWRSGPVDMLKRPGRRRRRGAPLEGPDVDVTAGATLVGGMAGVGAADVWAPPGAADVPFLLDWDEVVDEPTGNGDTSQHRDPIGGQPPPIDGWEPPDGERTDGEPPPAPPGD